MAVSMKHIVAAVLAAGPAANAAVLRQRDCSFTWPATVGDTCQIMADAWEITVAQFISYNTGVDCANPLVADRWYCVDWTGEPPPPPVTTTTTSATRTTTTATTTTSTGNGISTPTPTQPSMVSNCNKFHFVEPDQSCADVLAITGTTMAQLFEWNPSVGSNCNNMWSEVYVCIGIIGGSPPPTTTTPPPATTTGNGISTPTPSMPGMVSNCNKFYFVGGQSCQDVLTATGLTMAQLFAWNPSVGSNCNTLWAEVHVCIGVIGGSPPPTVTTTTTTSSSTTTTGNGISTPTPYMPGMVSNCDRFYKVKSGDNCATIGAAHDVRADRIIQWQPDVGTTCGILWLDTYVCVRTIGFQPSTQTSCGVGGGLRWGDNKPAAQNSVTYWCNGDSVNDGSGPFVMAQTKTGCYNAPYGSNRINFSARNGFGAAASLSVAKCNELVGMAVNNCEYGGSLTQEGWSISAVVVAGRCP